MKENNDNNYKTNDLRMYRVTYTRCVLNFLMKDSTRINEFLKLHSKEEMIFFLILQK